MQTKFLHAGRETIPGLRTVLVLTSEVQRFPGIAAGSSETPNHRILRGISEEAMRRKVSVPIQFVDERQAARLADPHKRPAAMRVGDVHGLVVVSAYAELIIKVLGETFPIVMIPGSEKSLDVDSCGPENLHGVEMLARHLHELGHRRIGYVSMKERPPWTHERFSGYLYAMNALGLSYRSEDVFNMFGPELNDRRLMECVIGSSRGGVTAWICASDELAAKVYCALAEAGISVPDEVSVTGFDGVEVFRHCPPITTVEVPWAAIGAGALVALLDRMQHPDQATSHRAYNGQFIQGQTTGQAPPARER